MDKKEKAIMYFGLGAGVLVGIAISLIFYGLSDKECVNSNQCEFKIGDEVYTRDGISPPVENGKVLKVTPRESTSCLILLEEDGEERELDEYWLIMK